jgi:predicted nucleic acid-binding protein
MLDSGPLGKLAHPAPRPEIVTWFQSLKSAQIDVIIPEIADFEIRRSFLLHDLKDSISALDRLRKELIFLAIDSSAMLTAAQLWANARRLGKPTADLKELDCDVILAAQAIHAKAIVATENIGHLARYVTAKNWRKIVFA